MKFTDSFDVPVPVATAWEVLTDIERVYPCLPGAQLTELKDGEFHGLVTLKLGPIMVSYKGTAVFESLDQENRQLVIRADGRDRHGQGTARARVEATLEEHTDGETRVTMVNEVDITGKAAQFGRGIITDVSKEIMGQFAANLRAVVVAPEPGPDAAPPSGSAPLEPPELAPPAVAPIGVAGLTTRIVVGRARDNPVATLSLVGLLILLLVRRRRIRAAR
jgi:uncharacterized protein